MLKISMVDTRGRRRVVVEGKLTGPWAAELKTVCGKLRADLGSRELMIDLKNVSDISAEGGEVLLQLMNEGVKVLCKGVFTTEYVRQLKEKVISPKANAGREDESI